MTSLETHVLKWRKKGRTIIKTYQFKFDGLLDISMNIKLLVYKHKTTENGNARSLMKNLMIITFVCVIFIFIFIIYSITQLYGFQFFLRNLGKLWSNFLKILFDYFISFWNIKCFYEGKGFY